MSDPRSDSNGYFLGRELAPTGFEWDFAPQSLRLRYWKQVGELAARAKDEDLAAGLDRHGRPLVPIAPSTRAARLNLNYSPMGRANPNAPPLTPCFAESRTRSLLRWRAYPDGVAFYWDFDVHTGASWGEVLDHHRKGVHGRVRDVFGLSPAATRAVKRKALAWWDRTLAKIPAATRKPIPEPTVPVRYAPKSSKKPPIAPCSTGWRTVGPDGSLVPLSFTPMHIDRLTAVGVGRR